MFNSRIPLYHPHSQKNASGPAPVQPDEGASASRTETEQGAVILPPFPGEDIFQPSHSRNVYGSPENGYDDYQSGLFTPCMQQAFSIPTTDQPAHLPLKDDNFLKYLPDDDFLRALHPAPFIPELAGWPTLPSNFSHGSSHSEKGKHQMTTPQLSEQFGCFSPDASGSSSLQPFNPFQPIPHDDSPMLTPLQPASEFEYGNWFTGSFSSYQADLEDLAELSRLISAGGLGHSELSANETKKMTHPTIGSSSGTVPDNLPDKGKNLIIISSAQANPTAGSSSPAASHLLDFNAMPDAPWHEDAFLKTGLETPQPTSTAKKHTGQKRKRPPAPPKDPRRAGILSSEQKKQFLDFYHAHQNSLSHPKIIKKFREEQFYLPDSTMKKWLQQDGIKEISAQELKFYDAFGIYLKRNADACQQICSKSYSFILNNFLRKEEGQSFSSVKIGTLVNFLGSFFQRNAELWQTNRNPERKKQFMAYFHAPENANKTKKQRREDFSKAFFPVSERTASQWFQKERGLSKKDLQFQEAFTAFYRKNPELADKPNNVLGSRFLQQDEGRPFSTLKLGTIRNHITRLFQHNPRLRDPQQPEDQAGPSARQENEADNIEG